MPDDKLDDVLSIFDDEKKEEGSKTESQEKQAAPASAGKTGARPMGGKPVVGAGFGKGAGATGSRGPASQTTTRPPAAMGARGAGVPSGGGQPAAKVPVSASPANGGASTMLLITLLMMNAVLLLVSSVSIIRVSALSKKLTETELNVAKLVERSKVHAGMTYLGPDKRPQRYVMLLDYEKEPGKIKFGQEISQPIE